MDSERSTLRARLRGGRAQPESQEPAGQGTGGRPSAKTNRPAPKRPSTLPSEPPCPHQAEHAAVPVGALGSRTQRAVVGEAAGVQAFLEPER